MDNDKKKIVIADDNIDVRDIVRSALENIGYKVGEAKDGFALIAYLKEHQDIDVVILDLMMPARDGISIFETIRSVSPASKIIIHTAFPNYRDTVFGKEADGFVDKMEGVEKIIEVLEELCR